MEIDVLPYATGGWYGSLWYGFGHLRIRGVISQVNPPDFTIEDGFTDARTRAYALLVDYFPRPGRTGPWLGAGIERWENSIAHPEEEMRGESADLVVPTTSWPSATSCGTRNRPTTPVAPARNTRIVVLPSSALETRQRRRL
jgi:hypothetical protein